jgi:hypothetical protein
MDTHDDCTIEQKIEKRIKELEKELKEFAERANRTVSFYEGAIAELKKLLEPPAPPPTE